MFFKKEIDYSKITEYDREKNTKRENYRILNEEYALKNQTVLLGDSITDFFNWYELFYDFSKISGQAVYNRGISGDTTDRLLERLNENVLNIEPKNVVLLIGTNDIGRGLPLSMSVENVSKIIENTKKVCPDINFILQAVYPINCGMRDKFEKRSNEKIDIMNKEFIMLSEEHDCVWLDITDKLKDETGNLKKEYTYDGLHLNVNAYKIVAENIIPLLK
ncbi:MAG: lysophospholipase [Clostridia bacterium]|nr:lysophospholipase [Clostridia bacterium]